MKGAHSSEGEGDNASAAWAHAWLPHHCKERSEFKLKVEREILHSMYKVINIYAPTTSHTHYTVLYLEQES